MGIRREQPGAAKAAATAGVAVGKAERAKEDRARAEREQARADQEAAQRAAQQKAMEFELFKMEQRSMQDFQQELRDKQYRFDEINTAKEWDIEKKRRHSEIDFEIEEKERLRQKQEISNKRAAIEKDIASGKSTKEEHELALFNLDRDEYAIDVGAARGAPLTQMPGDQGIEARAQGRYEMAQEAAGRAKKTAQRAQEAHEARMMDGISFAEKRAAEKYLSEHPEANWLEKLLPGGKGPLSDQTKKLKAEAEQILTETSIVNAPTPQSRAEFEIMVGQLKASDPVKARQYYDEYDAVTRR